MDVENHLFVEENCFPGECALAPSQSERVPDPKDQKGSLIPYSTNVCREMGMVVT